MPEITNGQIAKIARGLSVSRDVFARAYDDVASWQSPPSADFMTISGLADQEHPQDEGDDRDAFHYTRAMQRARDEDWLVEFVFEKFPELAGPDPVEPPTEEPPDDDHEGVARAVLHSIAHRQRRFQEGRRITARSLAALRRCCIVRTQRQTATGDAPEDVAIGSGFLIAPHLVLTNFHVVEDFVDANGHLLDPTKRPYVRFDYHAGASTIVSPRDYQLISGDRSWLLSHSPKVPDATSETFNTLIQNLDFAVMILDGRPGDMRGYYDIGHAPDLPKLLTQVQLWQFPEGQTTRMSGGDFVATPSVMGFPEQVSEHPRIYHTANSLPGASGGLLLREDGEPIGLHDAGFKDDAPEDQQKNRAVPLRHISREVSSLITQEIANLPPKRGWHPKKLQPVLGRLQLQQHIFDAAYKQARIVTIMTPPGDRIPKLGRTYSRTILEACLPSDAHHFVTIEASLIDPNPFTTARRIATSIDAAFAAEIPAETGETTMDADAIVLLVERTISILRRAAPGKTLWLIIDDIDADPIGTQWGSSNYLLALYRSIANSDELRLILSGLPRRLEGLRDLYEETGLILEEDLFEPPNKLELKDWIEGHLTHGLHPDDIAPGLADLFEGVANRDFDNLSGDDPFDEENEEDDDEDAPSPLDTMCRTKALNELLTRQARTAFKAKISSQ